MTRRLALAAFVLLGIFAAYQTWRLGRADAREFAAWVAQQREQLLAAGWERTAKATQAELARIVPALKAELAAATAAGARPILATHFEGKADTIHVPGVYPRETPPGGAAVSYPGPTEAPPGAAASTGCDVDPWVRLDEAIVADDGGGIYLKRVVDVQLQAGDWYSGWKPVKQTNLSAPKASVDPELEKAWAAWRHPKPRGIDVFIGASLGIDGPGIIGGVVGGAKHLGWWASGDYVLTDPSASRVAGGASIRF